MTASIPGTDRVSDRTIVERIKPYLPDVPDELLFGLVKGTHAVVEKKDDHFRQVTEKVDLVKDIITKLDTRRYEVSTPEGLRDPSLCGWPLSLLLEAIEQAGYAVVPREPTEAQR